MSYYNGMVSTAKSIPYIYIILGIVKQLQIFQKFKIQQTQKNYNFNYIYTSAQLLVTGYACQRAVDSHPRCTEECPESSE